MRHRMSLKARRELLRSIAERYQSSGRHAKAKILDEFTAATGYHRKSAIRLLRNALQQPITRHRRRAPVLYDSEVQRVLGILWELSGRICSRRLAPFLPELIDVLERHGHLSLEDRVKRLLSSISVSTVDRLLRPVRRGATPGGLSTTKSGSLLKHMIPVRTFADWDDVRPGFFETDLVAHCGTSMAGSFLNTLVLTDVTTGWTECLPLLVRDQDVVVRAIEAGRKRLPFPMLGLDSDNGKEFINYTLLEHCNREELTFTRCRPYRKNDQCHVEQKNGSIVRRTIGYDRFEGIEACRILAQLHETLRLWVNFFQPSMKLLSKTRTGSRVSKTYDRARTPYERVMRSDQVSEADKSDLAAQYQSLDPVPIFSELEELQNALWRLARPSPKEGDAPLKTTRDDDLNNAISILELCQMVGDDSLGDDHAKRDGRIYRRRKKTRVPHTWRTRADPFVDVWDKAAEKLEKEPDLTAKTIFLWLVNQHPGRFTSGQLRTLQRRVKEWRSERAADLVELS